MPRAVFRLLWGEIEAGRTVAAYVKNMAKDGAYYWVLALVTPVRGRLPLRPPQALEPAPRRRRRRLRRDPARFEQTVRGRRRGRRKEAIDAGLGSCRPALRARLPDLRRVHARRTRRRGEGPRARPSLGARSGLELPPGCTATLVPPRGRVGVLGRRRPRRPAARPSRRLHRAERRARPHLAVRPRARRGRPSLLAQRPARVHSRHAVAPRPSVRSPTSCASAPTGRRRRSSRWRSTSPRRAACSSRCSSRSGRASSRRR